MTPVSNLSRPCQSYCQVTLPGLLACRSSHHNACQWLFCFVLFFLFSSPLGHAVLDSATAQYLCIGLHCCRLRFQGGLKVVDLDNNTFTQKNRRKINNILGKHFFSWTCSNFEIIVKLMFAKNQIRPNRSMLKQKNKTKQNTCTVSTKIKFLHYFC